jgi:UDP-N-acetyl-D-glucosamine dehydrogenase
VNSTNDHLEGHLFRLTAGTYRLGIVGLGYVGLPLAHAAVEAGFSVVGFDVDETKVSLLRAGESYIGQVRPGHVCAMRDRGFHATAEFDRLSEPDALVICVPTPLGPSSEPDLSHVLEATKRVAHRMRVGQLIVLESTTFPGTSRNVVLPVLESRGLKAGLDFFLAYSPERQDPGHPERTVRAIPKVVGGFDAASLELASAVYSRIASSVVRVSSLEAAEACKMLENTYRAVNIALVNELKMLFDPIGVDIWETIGAASTKPFGYDAFHPGPGVGGHCIPVDPFYLSWLARRLGQTARFVELAGEINAAMPAWVVAKTVASLRERCKPIAGSSILLLGMAYKRDVDDSRESPGFSIMELLLQNGCGVEYHDPYIPRLPPMRCWPHLRKESIELTAATLESKDCIVIVTDHSCFDWPWIVEHSQLIVDTRNATRDVGVFLDRIVRA